ncbi:unnamed protein product [Pedinophyceae sp. YPF-701]|nr:unnamed protein product [Pedinophyceae sp. YPF-701]
MPGATKAQPRFVCVPGDDVSLSYKTVRAKPRPAGAVPEMETLLNIPTQDLEDLLKAALTRGKEILEETRGSGRASLLTRVASESTARDRDIQAVTWLIPQLDAPGGSCCDAFCRAISVEGERELRAMPRGDGEPSRPMDDGRVTAEVTVGGKTTLPVDIAPVCQDVFAAPGGPAAAMVALQGARTALSGGHKGTENGGLCFATRMEVGRAERRASIVMYGAWSEEAPGVIVLTETNEGASSGDPRRVAKLTARALRNSDDALRQLCVDALVPPMQDGVAAHLERGDQDWDAAGRFPAVALNILQSLDFSRPRAFLTLSEGMRWRRVRERARRTESGVPLLRLAAEITDGDAFCAQHAPSLPWKRCLGTFEEMLPLFQARACQTLGREGESAILEKLLLKYAEEGGMYTPGGLSAVEDAMRRNFEKFDALMAEMEGQEAAGWAEGPEQDVDDDDDWADAPPGDTAGSMDFTRPVVAPVDPSAATTGARLKAARADAASRFVCVSMRKASLAFKTVRAQPRHRDARPEMETFLNAPQDDVEEMLAVALRRSMDVFSNTPPDHRGGLGAMLTRVESECWARSRDLEATSTFIVSPDCTVAAICNAIDVDGRRLRAGSGAHGAGARHVFASLKTTGRACGTYNCTKFIAADQAALAASVKAVNTAVGDTGGESESLHECFAERVRTEDGREVEVFGGLSERYPHMILVGGGWETFGGDAGEAAASWDGNVEALAKVVVRGLRRLGALRALCAGALLPPLSKADAAASVPPAMGWDGRGGFPAVSVNVLLTTRGDSVAPVVWLELPRGMRWRRTGPARVVAEVESMEDVKKAHCRNYGTTWDVIARAAADLDGQLGTEASMGAEERHAAVQSLLDTCAAVRLLAHVPEDCQWYNEGIMSK